MQQQQIDLTSVSYDQLTQMAGKSRADRRQYEPVCRCGRPKVQHQLFLRGEFSGTHFYWPACPACEPIWSQVEEEVRRRDRVTYEAGAPARLAAKAKQLDERVVAEIGLRLATSTFQSFQVGTQAQGTALQAVRSGWWNRTTALAIIGPPGTGKTHLAVASFREAIAGGVDAVFLNEADLLREWRQASAQGEPFDLLQRVVNAGVLFLDDLGTGKYTESGLGLMYDVIDQRWRKGLPTFFTTNLVIAQLEAKFGEKLVSRILDRHSSVVLPLDGVNRRVRAA